MKDANCLVPEIEIVFSETDKRMIRCNYGVFLRFQKLTGKNAQDKEVLKSMTPEDHVRFLACCLYREKPEDHIEELAEKMTLEHALKMWEVIEQFSTLSEETKKKLEKKLENAAETSQNEG